MKGVVVVAGTVLPVSGLHSDDRVSSTVRTSSALDVRDGQTRSSAEYKEYLKAQASQANRYQNILKSSGGPAAFWSADAGGICKTFLKDKYFGDILAKAGESEPYCYKMITDFLENCNESVFHHVRKHKQISCSKSPEVKGYYYTTIADNPKEGYKTVKTTPLQHLIINDVLGKRDFEAQIMLLLDCADTDLFAKDSMHENIFDTLATLARNCRKDMSGVADCPVGDRDKLEKWTNEVMERVQTLVTCNVGTFYESEFKLSYPAECYHDQNLKPPLTIDIVKKVEELKNIVQKNQGFLPEPQKQRDFSPGEKVRLHGMSDANMNGLQGVIGHFWRMAGSPEPAYSVNFEHPEGFDANSSNWLKLGYQIHVGRFRAANLEPCTGCDM